MVGHFEYCDDTLSLPFCSVPWGHESSLCPDDPSHSSLSSRLSYQVNRQGTSVLVCNSLLFYRIMASKCKSSDASKVEYAKEKPKSASCK